ncbi:MAG: hypothetical protein ABIO70_30740 [Pseudomonadota bacterium]
MRRCLPYLVFITALPACHREEEPVDTTPPEDTAPEGPVYPTGDRILLYTGHGGATPSGSGGFGSFDDIDAHWKDLYGWNTDVRDSLGDDLSSYRLVGLMAPGLNGGGTFSVEEIDLLEHARRRGTRIAIFNEVDNCDTNVIGNLLENWGILPRFSGEGVDEFSMVAASFIGQEQMTEGVDEMRFSDPCFVEANGAPYVVSWEGNHIVAKDQPLGWGGEVVLIGDLEILDDTENYNLADNLVFDENLVKVEPGYQAR